QSAVEPGDLVLASAAVATAMDDKEAAAALAPFAKTPTSRYLISARKYNRSPSTRGLDPETRDGAIGALWTLRAAVAHDYQGDTTGGLALVQSMGDKAFLLRLVGTS